MSDQLLLTSDGRVNARRLETSAKDAPTAASTAGAPASPSEQTPVEGDGPVASCVGTDATPPAHFFLAFTVTGTPIPQGSHRGFVVNGRAVITQDNKKTRPWRTDVKHAAIDARGDLPPLDGPIEVFMRFVMPRPKHHFRTGRNAHLLRDNAPAFPASKPDGDKLVRAIFDALTAAGVWKDDSQVVHHDAWKVYAGHDGDPNEIPAAHITLVAAR